MPIKTSQKYPYNLMKIKKLILAKRISQALFFALFVYILMSTTYPLTGIISSQVLFKADPLVMLITSISERTIIPGIMWGLVMLFITVLIGRFFADGCVRWARL